MAKEIVVNERVTLLQPISTKDTAGSLVVPELIRYRIQDAESKTEIVPWTPLSLNSQQDIEITPDQNRIINEDSPYEERIITVEFWYFGMLRSGKDELRYKVKNLFGVETIQSVSASASQSPSASISPSASPSASVSPSASASPST